jgi:hypothetical protein
MESSSSWSRNLLFEEAHAGKDGQESSSNAASELEAMSAAIPTTERCPLPPLLPQALPGKSCHRKIGASHFLVRAVPSTVTLPPTPSADHVLVLFAAAASALCTTITTTTTTITTTVSRLVTLLTAVFTITLEPFHCVAVFLGNFRTWMQCFSAFALENVVSSFLGVLVSLLLTNFFR